MNGTIIAENLTHCFGRHQVLQGISFHVQKGEAFGLLGPSGVGKTTLIKILTGQLKQTSGIAKLLGTDTRNLGKTEHSHIGVMMDNFGLYERLSVYDNLAFYADIYHMPHSGINDILKSIGLYEARRKPVMELSKGMKNRLSFARAWMNHAKILFLDEPTSGLDPATVREIHAVLKKQKANGTTIFLTTHNMYEAESLCDHVALLSGGNIIEYGEPKAICRKYNHLNRLQITLKNENVISLENNRSAAKPVADYLQKEEIASIHSTEPTLESVMIELTGKGLN